MISLSLCMIVKNEEAVLERILKPVSQVMDAILIADTGSSDRTKEIAHLKRLQDPLKNCFFIFTIIHRLRYHISGS